MIKKYSIPVNQFNNRVELELHGIKNGLPALILFLAAFASYYFFNTAVTIMLVCLGMIWITFFVVLTYLFSNSRLYITQEGFILEKGKSGQEFIKWEGIRQLEFLALTEGAESIDPPIKLIIYIDGKEKGIDILLYKNRFHSPLFLYYKLLALLNCIPQAKRLLPNNIDKLHV